MNSIKIALGTLAGLAFGVVLGVLFAPKKGRVLRKNLIRKGEYLGGTVKDKFGEFLNNISDKIEEVKREVF
jgi:gas vesicle protein